MGDGTRGRYSHPAGTRTGSVPHFWDWTASRFINIQLLNAVAFESVTGLAVPPSPVTLEEYTKAKILSLSFYPSDDERLLEF